MLWFPAAREDVPVLNDLLACPHCRQHLNTTDLGHTCPSCNRQFPTEDGIPILSDPASAHHDELDHLAEAHHSGSTNSHKRAQADHFDRAGLAEFEIERPAGAPALYQFLIDEKMRRAIEPLGKRLDGWTALTVCGGSGMDAEYLARAGASVITSDLSFEASRRARERSERHGVELQPIVADIEHLPFPDRSVDLVLVHDGLHHLEDPKAGLREMTRVARRAVCITEPAAAAVTSLAVRLGLALATEEAGNRVARLDAAATSKALTEAGFRVASAQRYAMYYKHVPGRVTRLLSRPIVFNMLVPLWRVVNRATGSFGNKLVVVGIREDGADRRFGEPAVSLPGP